VALLVAAVRALAVPAHIGVALCFVLGFRGVLVAGWLPDAAELLRRQARWAAALAAVAATATTAVDAAHPAQQLLRRRLRDPRHGKPPGSSSSAPAEEEALDWAAVATLSLQRGLLLDSCAVCLSPLARGANAPPPPGAVSAAAASAATATASIAAVPVRVAASPPSPPQYPLTLVAGGPQPRLRRS
jgi:hypothetical protein